MERASHPSLKVVAIVSLIVLVVAIQSHGQELVERPIRAEAVEGPTLLLHSSLPGFYVPVAAVKTSVRIDVRGFVVRGTVVQTFENPTDQCVETLYVFPLPENAAVDQLVMTANGRRVVGEIHEKEEARQIYEEARNSGQRASLLEQHRPNVFSVELTGLGPRERVEIEIGYQQILDYRKSGFSLRVPLVVGPRYDPDTGSEASASDLPRIAYQAAANGNRVEVRVKLDAGIALSEIESPTHEIDAVQTGQTTWTVTLPSDVPANRDFVLKWTPRLGSEPVVSTFVDEVTRADGSMERFTLLAFMPPREPSGRISMSRELVVIIDTSGSMGGEPLRQAKEAVALALDRLNPADRFHLIEFNSVTRTFESGPIWADHDAIERAKRWVSGLASQGGTNILPALEVALGEQEETPAMLRQVIFVTDGMVSNERELASYVRKNIGRSRLFTVGIGSAPNGHLMRTLARQGRGAVTHIDGIDRVGESMSELFAMIEHPALTDLTVSHADPSAEAYPGVIADLYAGEPVLLTIRHTAPASRVRIDGRRGSRAWTREIEPTVRPVTTSGIEKLWARRKVEALEEEMLDRDDPSSLRERIVQTALRHGLVSTYTSLVAVDRTTAGYTGCEPVPIPLEAPAGMEHLLNQRLPGTATPFQWLLLIGLSLLTAAATWEIVSAEVIRRRAAVESKSIESGGVR